VLCLTQQAPKGHPGYGACSAPTTRIKDQFAVELLYLTQ
jgi:hypothetical protein